MTTSVLTQKTTNHITCVTINRPQACNSLNGELLQALRTTFTDLNTDPDTRVIILTAAKREPSQRPVFCAGADLKERTHMTAEEVEARILDYSATFGAVANVRQPVIAALNGDAIGGGLELALTCDLRLLAADARVGLRETHLGIIPGAGGTQRLPRLIGIPKAKELIFTARLLNANEAEQIGLVNWVAPPSELLDKAYEYAEEIAKNAPIALAEAKKAINLGMQTNINEALIIERKCYYQTVPTEDRLEGLAAMSERREPRWKNQ